MNRIKRWFVDRKKQSRMDKIGWIKEHISEYDLKPCPFCGGAPEIHESLGEVSYVRCSKCFVTGPAFIYESGEVLDEMEAWNVRQD